mmetsp:Transcript_16146/g.23751  ORF Transcript_16146/g.23751 Transcript_16146/m.23751 type:complete len:214 (+) Transcript_16146:38-679(+)
MTNYANSTDTGCSSIQEVDVTNDGATPLCSRPDVLTTEDTKEDDDNNCDMFMKKAKAIYVAKRTQLISRLAKEQNSLDELVSGDHEEPQRLLQSLNDSLSSSFDDSTHSLRSPGKLENSETKQQANAESKLTMGPSLLKRMVSFSNCNAVEVNDRSERRRIEKRLNELNKQNIEFWGHDQAEESDKKNRNKRASGTWLSKFGHKIRFRSRKSK